MFQFASTKQKFPGKSEVRKTLQNCGSSILKFIHVTFLALTVWKWRLDVWKICEALGKSIAPTKYCHILLLCK
jgi:hypothetical protein